VARTGKQQRRKRADDQVEPESVSTATFSRLLSDLGISLLVSTYQSHHVILVRAQDDATVNTHFVRFSSPMGIAIRGDRIAVASPGAISYFYDQPVLAPGIEPKGQHDACFLPRRLDSTGNIRCHEIGFAGDELWLVNTHFSALCTLDGVHSFVPRWRPPFVTKLAPEDRCHLNGLAVDDGRPRTVTAFSETDVAQGWRAVTGATGVAIDVASGETVVRGLRQPHSPRWYRGDLWLLGSGEGTLAKADLSRGRAETFAELPGFTRGLAFAGPYAFVGLSQIRDHVIFTGIPLLDRVKALACGVWVIDLRSGAIAAWLRFDSGVREIFDVQVLGRRYPMLFPRESPMPGSMFVLPEGVETEIATRTPAASRTASGRSSARSRARGKR
jgi:uncharacterized protein (TIGR03032 family)